MAEYLTAFNNHTQYTAFTGTSAYLRPNVSLCKEEEEVHYGPIPPGYVCFFWSNSIASEEVTTRIMSDTVHDNFYSYFSGWSTQPTYYMHEGVPDVLQHGMEYYYTYYLLKGDAIKAGSLSGLTKQRYLRASGSSEITAIEDGAFMNSEIQTIKFESIVPPTLGVNVFQGCSSLTNIYVPAQSVDAYKAATNWSAYASLISAG